MGNPAGDPAAQREARHERREHGSDRELAGAEDEMELATPHRLVDESSGTGAEEQQVEHGGGLLR